jgi:hypothetical protein
VSGGRVPISADARGRYRIWRAAAQLTADRVEAVTHSRAVGMASGNFVRCGSQKGRERALNHLRRALEGAGARFIDRGERQVRWAYLRPADDLIYTDLITISREGCGAHGWLIVFSDHALKRAVQRSAPGLDLTALIWDAVENTRRLSIRFLLSRTTPDRFRVAAGEGAFACAMHLIAPNGNEIPLVIAATFLTLDQMSGIQEAEIVDDGHPGERFDDVYQQCRDEWILPPIVKRRYEARG